MKYTHFVLQKLGAFVQSRETTGRYYAAAWLGLSEILNKVNVNLPKPGYYFNTYGLVDFCQADEGSLKNNCSTTLYLGINLRPFLSGIWKQRNFTTIQYLSSNQPYSQYNK